MRIRSAANLDVTDLYDSSAARGMKPSSHSVVNADEATMKVFASRAKRLARSQQCRGKPMRTVALEATPDIALTARDVAVLAEAIDTRNWLDQHAAAPDTVRNGLMLDHRCADGLAMVSSAIPFSHFNMVLTLGCPAVAGPEALQAIDRFYAASPAGRHWIVVNDHSEPYELGRQLMQHGYVEADKWDRVVLRGARQEIWRPHASGCEIVGDRNAEDWVNFLLKSYGMPQPVGHWLRALVGRPGWIHALRREDGRDAGPVVMVRSLFHADGWAWLGIDAPIPGVMAPCFDDDRGVVSALLCEAAGRGAHSFVSDIEVASPTRSGPQYAYWNELGFEAIYLRRVFVKPNGGQSA
jgi:hypothetical protein